MRLERNRSGSLLGVKRFENMLPFRSEFFFLFFLSLFLLTLNRLVVSTGWFHLEAEIDSAMYQHIFTVLIISFSSLHAIMTHRHTSLQS